MRNTIKAKVGYVMLTKCFSMTLQKIRLNLMTTAECQNFTK